MLWPVSVCLRYIGCKIKSSLIIPLNEVKVSVSTYLAQNVYTGVCELQSKL